MLPRWRWSISKAFESVTESDLMLASPCAGPEVEAAAPGSRRGGSSCDRRAGGRHLRLEAERRAVDRMEVASEKSVTVPWSPIPWLSTEKGEQLVGLIVKFGLVDVDLDRAHPDRHAADDRRDRVGGGEDLCGLRVDVQGDPDDDDAVVVGSGEGRRDRDDARAARL